MRKDTNNIYKMNEFIFLITLILHLLFFIQNFIK